MGFYLKMNVWYYFVDPRLASRSKGLFKVKNKMVARYFKVKYDFSTNEARNKCNSSFSCDFDREFIYCIICMVQGHLQVQNGKYQGQLSKITVFNK